MLEKLLSALNQRNASAILDSVKFLLLGVPTDNPAVSVDTIINMFWQQLEQKKCFNHDSLSAASSMAVVDRNSGRTAEQTHCWAYQCLNSAHCLYNDSKWIFGT